MGDRYISLVRHGKYNKADTGRNGGDLIGMGMEQAARVGQELAHQSTPVTSMTSSTLTRAVTTATIMSEFMAPAGITTFRKDRNLCEAVFHIPESERDYFDRTQGYISPESVTSQRIRVAYAYDTYMRPASDIYDEHDVLVCHGNIIRYFIVRTMNMPMDMWTQMEIYHGSITRFVISPNGDARLISQNEVSHLPSQMWSVS